MSTTNDRLHKADFPAGYADILMEALAIGPDNFLNVKDALHHFRQLDDGQAAEVMEHSADRLETDKAEEASDSPLARIARAHLGIETLDTRNSDSLDFHDVAVWSVKAALIAAFQAGAASGPASEATTDGTPIVTVKVQGGLIEDMDATIPVDVVIEDWDIPDEDSGKRPARSVWTLAGGISGPKAEKFRRLIAND